MTYPTFETRLVPISEHPLTEGKTLVVDKYFEDGFPVKARYLPTVKGKMRWISNLRTGCYYQISPTHFLQFKINGEWTHEFNLNKERNKMNHFKLIEQWAEDRNLIKGSNRDAQMVKLIEEIGEVASAISKGKEDEVMKEIGDAMVVLTIIAAQSDIKIEDCLGAAWNKIKDRKGKLINGKFVKEEDLPENDK